MKTFLKITISLLLLLNACQKQTPVELVDNTDDSNLINIQTLPPSVDSLYIISGEDSSGNIGMWNSKFFAKMVFQAIRIDRAIKSDSFVIAEAIFFDKNNPIRHNNRTIAYPSFDIGLLRFNNQILNKFQRRIMVPMHGDSAIGYRYHLRNSYEYNYINSWSSSGNDSFPPMEFTINTPAQIRITNLTAGSISVTEPLNIKWNCSNPEINLFISAESGSLLQRQLIPVLHLKIKNTKGEITIPVRILELLPVRKYSRFMFTFTSENKFTREISGYPEKILIYTASVHSIMMNLQP